jgi:hypothetical protein
MALTQAITKTALKEGMRTVPDVGDNVDRPAVDANFNGLAAGVLAVLTKADTQSGAAVDATFWAWVADLTAWAGALHTWESGINAAIDAWTPATQSETALRTALKAVARPPKAPPATAPIGLEGKIV